VWSASIVHCCPGELSQCDNITSVPLSATFPGAVTPRHRCAFPGPVIRPVLGSLSGVVAEGFVVGAGGAGRFVGAGGGGVVGLVGGGESPLDDEDGEVEGGAGDNAGADGGDGSGCALPTARESPSICERSTPTPTVPPAMSAKVATRATAQTTDLDPLFSRVSKGIPVSCCFPPLPPVPTIDSLNCAESSVRVHWATARPKVPEVRPHGARTGASWAGAADRLWTPVIISLLRGCPAT
jgi:hypothetical protein